MIITSPNLSLPTEYMKEYDGPTISMWRLPSYQFFSRCYVNLHRERVDINCLEVPAYTEVKAL